MGRRVDFIGGLIKAVFTAHEPNELVCSGNVIHTTLIVPSEYTCLKLSVVRCSSRSVRNRPRRWRRTLRLTYFNASGVTGSGQLSEYAVNDAWVRRRGMRDVAVLRRQLSLICLASIASCQHARLAVLASLMRDSLPDALSSYRLNQVACQMHTPGINVELNLHVYHSW